MKKFGKLAAVCALTAAFAVLTACGGKNGPTPQQNQQQVQNTENLITELDEQIIKSKVTSADSTAQSFIVTVRTYIADCMTYSGMKWESGTIDILVTDGEWTLSGYDVGAYKPDNMREELLDILREDFIDLKTAFAKVYLNEDGKAYAAIFSPSGKLDDSEYPDETAFENEKWKWDGKTVGVTPKGNILGTCPRLFLDEG